MNPFYVESIALINTFQRHQQGRREPDKKKTLQRSLKFWERKRKSMKKHLSIFWPVYLWLALTVVLCFIIAIAEM